VISAGAGHDRHASGGRLNDRRGDGPTLVSRDGGRLAGRAAADEEVDSLLDLPPDQTRDRVEVDPPPLVERGDEGSAASFPADTRSGFQKPSEAREGFVSSRMADATTEAAGRA